MEEKYILGVDGGGTKTDYLIFTTEGRWVGSLRVGSRSHEVLSGGFNEVEEKLLSDLKVLLKRYSISKAQIVAAAFGMAGIDVPSQVERIKSILDKFKLNQYIVVNDSVLGIKAGCTYGVGICSINGTGTVTTGINEKGEILQVGGIGLTTGDYAGGFFIASLTVRAVYDYYFRCGPETMLTDKIMRLFNIKESKKLINAISEEFYKNRNLDKIIVTYLFDAANERDEAAMNIVKEVANQLAKSVSGCMLDLGFNGIPEVILAGSVWTKTNCPLLLAHFKECIYQFTKKKVNPTPLQVIPAAGAVLWALELTQGYPVTHEQRLFIANHKELKNL